MIWNTIAVAIMLISACLIAVMIIRKFPQLASIEISTIPKEREGQLKKQLMMDKVARRIRFWLTRVEMVKILFYRLQNYLKRIFRKLKDIERRLSLKRGRNITGVLDRANKLMDIDSDESERLYLEIVKQDSGNIEAYEGLAELYILKKEWREVIEAFEFLVKLNPFKDKQYIFQIARAAREIGDLEHALECAEKLILSYSSEPRFLDFFTEIAILVKDKRRAERGIFLLRQVNPDNAKIEELEKKINNL